MVAQPYHVSQFTGLSLIAHLRVRPRWVTFLRMVARTASRLPFTASEASPSSAGTAAIIAVADFAGEVVGHDEPGGPTLAEGYFPAQMTVAWMK